MLAAVQYATAIPLPPGTLAPLPPEPDPVNGNAIAWSLNPFTAPTFSGTLTTTVWAGDVSNPWGGLTFTYELVNNAVSPDAIDRFTLSSYLGFQVDASYQMVAGNESNIMPSGVIPSSVVRNVAGNQISFNFADPLLQPTLLPGSSSVILVLQTDAQTYQNTLAGVINSSTANVPTFAPLAVPEPTTTAVVILGALGMARRRK